MGTPKISFGGGSLTREQFLLREMHIVAGLRLRGEQDDDIVERVRRENLFQYGTERMLADRARVCLRRLDANLYAMMRSYDLVRAFVGTEIGGRLASLNYSFTRADMNAFFTHYQLENPNTAEWSDSTVTRIKSTLSACLVNSGMLDSTQGGHLSPIMLDFDVEAAMNANGDANMAAALAGMGAM